eukprot:6193810-Pleurochrysis_carterae.AAC.1
MQPRSYKGQAPSKLSSKGMRGRQDFSLCRDWARGHMKIARSNILSATAQCGVATCFCARLQRHALAAHAHGDVPSLLASRQRRSEAARQRSQLPRESVQYGVSDMCVR